MTAIVVGPATAAEVGAFYHTPDQMTLRVDDEAVALGELRQIGARAWACLTVTPKGRPHALTIVRHAHCHLKARNVTVHAVCAYPDFPEAERLLRLLGFTPTDETVADGKRVWRWQAR